VASFSSNKEENEMSKRIALAALAAPVALFLGMPANAMPIQGDIGGTGAIVQVVGGCGPGAWRGPWGHCRDAPYYGLRTAAERRMEIIEEASEPRIVSRCDIKQTGAENEKYRPA
jgi:hypothetical protein